MLAGEKTRIVAGALLLVTVGLAAGASAGEPWRFIAVGDSRGDNNGVNAAILTEIRDQILAEQPDVVSFSGDLVTGSTNVNTLISQLTNWRTIMQPVYDAGIRVLAVRGNHENQSSVSGWNAVLTGSYAMPDNGPAGELNCTFSFEHKNAFFVGLDVYFSHPHRVNQPWLDGQLAANTRPHLFVMAHEPAFKANHADCLDDYPTDRDQFWQSLAAHGGRIYTCGHDHLYDHARIDDRDGNPDNDVHQLIVGTAGAPFHYFNGVYDGVNNDYLPIQQYDASNYGYVVGEVDGLAVRVTWKERTSPGVYTALESWSYLVHPEPRPGDLNCDGAVDFGDINPFVLILTDPGAWQAEFPGCPAANGDVNGDGAVDFADINPFVALLGGS